MRNSGLLPPPLPPWGPGVRIATKKGILRASKNQRALAPASTQLEKSCSISIHTRRKKRHTKRVGVVFARARLRALETLVVELTCRFVRTPLFRARISRKERRRRGKRNHTPAQTHPSPQCTLFTTLRPPPSHSPSRIHPQTPLSPLSLSHISKATSITLPSERLVRVGVRKSGCGSSNTKNPFQSTSPSYPPTENKSPFAPVRPTKTRTSFPHTTRQQFPHVNPGHEP